MALAEILVDARSSNGILYVARGDVGVVSDIRNDGILAVERGNIGVVSNLLDTTDGQYPMVDVREPVPLLGPISITNLSPVGFRPWVMITES